MTDEVKNDLDGIRASCVYVERRRARNANKHTYEQGNFSLAVLMHIEARRALFDLALLLLCVATFSYLVICLEQAEST